MRSVLARWTTLPLLVLAVPVSSWAFGLGEIELQSGFRQPLRARIELLSATPEILESLRVDLAPVASFEQFAVDRPAFLSSFEFTLGRDETGRNVLLVTSAEPISELFVTMFVEARWAGGVSLREYTMLLDPPLRQTEDATFVQARPTQQPQANVVGDEIERLAMGSTAQAGASDATDDTQSASTGGASTAADSGSEVRTHGPVQRAETLWDIAALFRPAGVTMNQAMVAIYEANPQAFGNNMNVLRIGAVLRIPDLFALRNVAANTAAAEVGRQTAEWQTRSPQQAPPTVPSQRADPGAAVEETQAPEPVEDTQISALREQIGALQSDLADIRRALANRDEQLSDLRAQLAARGAPAAVTPPAPATLVSPPAAAVAAMDPESIPLFPEELPVEDPPGADALALPPAAAGVAEGAQDLAAMPEDRSAVSRALPLIVAALVAVGIAALLLTALLMRRRRSRVAVVGGTDAPPALEGTIDAGDTCQISAQFAKALDDDFVVHEQQLDTGDRDSRGESLLVEEIADPLAETGFDMASRSCDQAAAQVLKELEKDPDSRELKLRLTEVYFQWGNKEAFLEVARELRPDAGGHADDVWDKVVIMGQQMFPDEVLFTAAPLSAGELDLHLQGQNSSALDLAFDEPDEEEVDVDIGSVDEAEAAEIDGSAVTARSEAAAAIAARSPEIGDGEETVDLPPAAAKPDGRTDAPSESDELPNSEESSTITQEWQELDASATLEELAADASYLTATCEMPDATVAEAADDHATHEAPLPAEGLLGELADNEGHALEVADDLLTKLDLAKAYLTIGQPELAIPLLEEALREAEDGPEKTKRMLEEALREAEAELDKGSKRSA